MSVTLGLDIGSNSVGSAWVDTERRVIRLGASVFPAGVDETDAKRGAPVNQKRRQTRSLRRSIGRRAERKRRLRRVLAEGGLLPCDTAELKALFEANPWVLRREALRRELTPYEFGRVLVHLNQRRGALGVETDPEDSDEGKVKEAIDRLGAKLEGRTIGEFMADEMESEARRIPIQGSKAKHCLKPIRNRRDSFEFHAHRGWLGDEFNRMWNAQRDYGGRLAKLLTDALRKKLDDPDGDETWRHKGVVFGQRRTYWDTGTLGRCDLEPTEHRCPIHDMHAQQFRVMETVNNIRLRERGKRRWSSLNSQQRDDVIGALRKQKSGSVATVRRALGIDKRTLKKRDLPEDYYELNLESDEDREINTDRFYREVVHGVFGEEAWGNLSEAQKESVNRALLKLDPDNSKQVQKLRAGAKSWWGLGSEAADKLVEVWQGRGRTDKRLRMSRRAICNLIPYMERFDKGEDRWPTQIEAKQMFAEDTANGASPEQRIRYAHSVTDRVKDAILRQVGGRVSEFERLLRLRGSSRADRQFVAKHPDLLPPAPTLSNPVVRKTIHEVRRHVMAHVREFGCWPDRIMIELARQARQSERVRNDALARNRNREKTRKRITEQFGLGSQTPNQRRTAQERVILCRQQRGVCAYTGDPISERQAALGKTDAGRRLEIDHIVPYSRSGDNSLNNKVLCYVEENRGKGSKTPREWWGDQFDDKIRPLAFMAGFRPDKLDYFTKRDYARKWENLTREVRPEDEWKNSQLTDTAYAGTQVMSYLRDAVFGGRQERDRGVFETNGRYTAILRRDWGLVGERGKSRDDHRHHAIDALVIALTHPRDLLPQLARSEGQREEYHERTGYWQRREAQPVPAPWDSVDEFREQVMGIREGLVISHRPVKRKLVGAFHEETLFGPVRDRDEHFTNRIGVDRLTPNHLSLPRPETEKESVERLARRYEGKLLSKVQARKKARQVVRSTGFSPRIVDPPPGKSGIVRDRDLRRILRDCVNSWMEEKQINRNADSFSSADATKMSEAGAFRMPSGVPIKGVILLRSMKDPVVIRRKAWDPVADRMIVDCDPRTRRVYVGGNNHHIEIREDARGKWIGQVVPTFDAAKRVRADGLGAVDRSDTDDGRFVMSLAEGETVYMGHPKSGRPGYFVVFKLDKPHTVHFQHHWDARRDSGRKNEEGAMIPSSKREDIAVTVADLKRKCSLDNGRAPYKVRVGPLGDVTPLAGD